MNTSAIVTGYEVRAFDPRTLGVVKYGRVQTVGRNFARIDFGVTGAVRVRISDIVEVTDTRPPDVACPLCGQACRVGLHDSAHCGACFLSFRASDPLSSLPKRMTRLELDSLTVVRTRDDQTQIVNSSGVVGSYSDRDEAYAEVLRLRQA